MNTTKEPHLPDGTLLRQGSYRIVRFLASGGFGNTYEAVHTSFGDRVAIKELFISGVCSRSADREGVTVSVADNQAPFQSHKRRFFREAVRQHELSHAGIVRVSDVFEQNGTAYYVMKYIEGESLGARLKRTGRPLTEADVRRYMSGVFEALSYVHGQGLLHLDLKPGNIMIETATDRPVLIDFGASKQVASESGQGNTTTTTLAYTPGYAPSEQMEQAIHKFGAWTDVYALGATMYTLLSGEKPPLPTDIADEGLPTLSSVSPSLMAAIRAALSPRRGDRPQSVEALQALMEGADSDDTVTVSSGGAAHRAPVVAPPAAPKAPRRPEEDRAARPNKNLWIVALVALVAMTIGGIGLYRLGQSQRTSPSAPAAEVVATPAPASPPTASQTGTVASTQPSAPQPATTAPAATSTTATQPKPEPKPEPKPQQPATSTPAASTTPKPQPQATSQTTAKSGTRTFTVGGVSFTMVSVAGGTFTMGATAEQKNPYDDEKPTHSVTLSGFSIGQTEVTQALWKAVMGSNPSYFKGDNLPVEEVSWNDCQTFIGKLNQLTGEHFRLPTEAEWEYAARGGRSSRGYQYSGSNQLSDVAWYGDNSNNKTHPVATKQANELGLYDMSGNVWEWCQDWKGSYSSGAQTNPSGPASGSNRVNRGGSWGCNALICRSAIRYWNTPGIRHYYVGFRLAL